VRDKNGSGLGLSISKAIVEHHHGSIAVTSVPGRTVFTISLPQWRSGEADSPPGDQATWRTRG